MLLKPVEQCPHSKVPELNQSAVERREEPITKAQPARSGEGRRGPGAAKKAPCTTWMKAYSLDAIALCLELREHR